VLVLCGCTISVLTFGPRSSLGFFLTPLSQTNGWGRDVFALALAIQNLLWGLGQPIAGAIADKFGAPRVLCVGVSMYALGLYLTSVAATPGMLSLSAGMLIGFGLSGCAVPSVIGALGKLLPDSWRSLAFRRRHGGWLVRAVPVLAVGGPTDGSLRLAEHAGDLLVLATARHPAVADADPAAPAGGRGVHCGAPHSR